MNYSDGRTPHENPLGESGKTIVSRAVDGDAPAQRLALRQRGGQVGRVRQGKPLSPRSDYQHDLRAP
eukprot:7151717-Pyramimonas_sp.AAC.1